MIRLVRTGIVNRLAYYFVDSVGFVAIVTLYGYFIEKMPAKELIIQASMLFAASFLISFFTVERRVKKYNIYLANLEDDFESQ